jgi:predicted RNase H-like nuclease
LIRLGSARVVVGVDGCQGGWLAVIRKEKAPLVAQVYGSFADLMSGVGSSARIAIDIPIGLPARGARACELEARQLLGRPRMASVFPAPPMKCLRADTYKQACQIRLRIDGKKMSLQAYGILPKIREVERYLLLHARLRRRIAEVHPEVSFATWQGGGGLKYSKKTAAGKAERRALIDQRWPGAVDRLRIGLRGQDYALDDLHDAFAALWSASRWLRGEGKFLGSRPAADRGGGPAGILV